jgi:hypothetical protein
MKISRILPVAGILTLLACGAAFTQSPPIPPGAGVGVHRQPPGSRFHHHPTKPTHAHHSATSPDKRVNSRAVHRRASP